ncbi:MAG: AIR synthase-related protein, partial [Candidatus Thiodiazotropha sp. 6PLUC6]
GFGLLGTLMQMCECSGVHALVDRGRVPLLDGVEHYLDLGCAPGGSQRNYDSYGQCLAAMTERDIQIFLDPQTSGGLLVSVRPEAEPEFLATAAEQGLELKAFGELIPSDEGPRIRFC